MEPYDEDSGRFTLWSNEYTTIEQLILVILVNVLFKMYASNNATSIAEYRSDEADDWLLSDLVSFIRKASTELKLSSRVIMYWAAFLILSAHTTLFVSWSTTQTALDPAENPLFVVDKWRRGDLSEIILSFVHITSARWSIWLRRVND